MRRRETRFAPRDLGVAPKTARVVKAGMERGYHFGAQVYAATSDPDTVLSFGMGNARPNVPMTEHTLMPWLSTSKPIAAVTLGQLRDRGDLRFEDRVADRRSPRAAKATSPSTTF